MKLVSWNVNGVNACIRKGLLDFIEREGADIYCFQETRSSPERVDDRLLDLADWCQFWVSAEKKGYSGTLVLSKSEPLSVVKGFGVRKFDAEGRVLTLEYEDFFLTNSYFPHSGWQLDRLDFKLEFNRAFEDFIQELRGGKPVVVAGDLNVAHREIDLANPTSNKKNAGFTPEERAWLDALLKKGYVDTFREFHHRAGQYTWWAYRYNARRRNIGWRLDYFLISEELRSRLKNSDILSDVMGSDHAPIRMELA
jgi:exodeoxyribonuclease-3